MKFELTEDQIALAVKFKREHWQKHPKQTAIGGAFTFSFTPTSIGDVCKIRCYCGEELDVSDYEKW